VSLVGARLAEQRAVAFLDDVDRGSGDLPETWLQRHPRGVVGAHTPPSPALRDQVIPLAVPSVADDPEALPRLFKVLALQEGLPLPLPGALLAPPLPASLRAAHNRILRWKLLGQLPEPELQPQSLPLDEDSLPLNLHVLERLLLHRALRRAYGNRVEAARRLGVSRRQLYLLIERHGDPLRAEAPVSEGPKRLRKEREKQNSSQG